MDACLTTCLFAFIAVSCGSDSDSVVNLLESPCVVRGTWTTPTIDALHQLHRLEPLPLSPDWNRFEMISVRI